MASPRISPLAAAGLLTLLCLLVGAPFLLASYTVHIMSSIGVAIVLALGLNLLMGYAGQVSLANAAFFGIGSYAVAILGGTYHVPFWLSVPIAGVATAAIGFVVGLPALRVSSHYLALATLAFVWTAQVIFRNWVSVTGGPGGYSVTRSALVLGAFESERSYYFLSLALTLVMVVLARNLIFSRTGRALQALRDDENAASLMGVNLAVYKTQAFAINAFFCAVAGGMQVGLVKVIDPDDFNLWLSIWHLLYIVVGGLGSIAGSIVGPVLLVILPETLRALAEYRELIFALLLLGVLIFLPGGIVGTYRPLRRAVVPAPRSSGVPPAPVAMRRKAPPRPGGAATPVLSIRDLSLAFGGLKALQSVDLTLRAGEVRALIGPNGAGKTTLLNVISRVYAPHSGTMMLNDKKLLRYRSHDLTALGIVRTFQNVRLFGRMTVVENVMVAMHAELRSFLIESALRLPRMRAEDREARALATEMLRYVGLDHLAERPAGALAFGQQRRLELARALAARPHLLLLDEPASGLDKDEIRELSAILRTIRDDLQVTILLIEHNMNFVMRLADSVTVLDHGVVIAEGTPAEIQKNERVIEAYLGKGHTLAPT